ncbi:MAG: DUF4349 domain-containing protein [Gaiellaceae bacterium]
MLSPELASELRAARPVASSKLHERVLELAARERPAPRPQFSLPPLRRLALVAVPAALAVAVGGALLHGLVNSGSAGKKAAPAPQPAARARGIRVPHEPPALPNTGAPSATALPNTQQARLQQYGAYLRLQVEDVGALSDATKRAMRFARDVGGYVAYVRYSSPAHGQGAASLIVRVPVDRVQDVIEEYSNLGTILSQKVNIVDVTKAVEEQAREIARLRAQIARIEAGGVTPQERYRLAELKARLDYLTKHRAATVRRAQLARVALELATKPKHHAAASTGRFDRTMSDAGGVLVREAAILLYALIVAGPLLLLGLGAVALGRMQRRRFEDRVLERP